MERYSNNWDCLRWSGLISSMVQGTELSLKQLLANGRIHAWIKKQQHERFVPELQTKSQECKAEIWQRNHNTA